MICHSLRGKSIDQQINNSLLCRLKVIQSKRESKREDYKVKDIEATIGNLIEKNNGYLITSEAVEQGISKPTISKYIKEHDMEKAAHGIYILNDVWPDELFVLQARNSAIIYSGETALYLHKLTDREYSHIYFVVPTGYNASHIKADKIVRYENPVEYELGVCEVEASSGNLVRVYDKERCICDLVKNRKNTEIQLYQTAIKEYMSDKHKNLSHLIKYAEVLGVRDEVMKYVEVLV